MDVLLVYELMDAWLKTEAIFVCRRGVEMGALEDRIVSLEARDLGNARE